MTTLLPAGAQEASLEGRVSVGARVATLTYRGSHGYPLHFLYRLLGGRDLAAAWFWDPDANRWRGCGADAPGFANEIDSLTDGATITIMFAP